MRALEQKAIGEMFDRIATTYDRVNSILSFGQDKLWRKQVAQKLPEAQNLSVLDVACGTGDLLIALCRHHKSILKAVGVDISENMLAIAKSKVLKAELSQRIEFKAADACDLPYPKDSLDVITIGFGIRNITEVDRALLEFARVLKTTGCLMVLEFSLPKGRLIRGAYLFYFRHILPVLGGYFSKDYDAYRYLNKSVESFPHGENFRQILLKNGFMNVEMTPISLGIATLYYARKS